MTIADRSTKLIALTPKAVCHADLIAVVSVDKSFSTEKHQILELQRVEPGSSSNVVDVLCHRKLT